jgi:hypothetical protein
VLLEGSRLLSYASVAAILDCSQDTVRRLVRSGLLAPPEAYPHLGLRFRSEEVYKYLYTQAGRGAVKGKNDAAKSRRKPQMGPDEGDVKKP